MGLTLAHREEGVREIAWDKGEDKFLEKKIEENIKMAFMRKAISLDSEFFRELIFSFWPLKRLDQGQRPYSFFD